MGANLIGSVAAGLVAVVLGTALARGLSGLADRPIAAGTRGGEAMATGLLDLAKSGDGQPISANRDRPQAPGDRPDADGGSRR